MLRLSIMGTFLTLISCIGLTFGPFEPMAFSLYNLFATIGTNPSFTPVTVDMSMMTSPEGENSFADTMYLVAKSKDSQFVLQPADLDLYRLKLPIIQFLEQAAVDVDLKEARFAICHQLQSQTDQPLESFYVRKGHKLLGEKLFHKEFDCDFTPPH